MPELATIRASRSRPHCTKQGWGRSSKRCQQTAVLLIRNLGNNLRRCSERHDRWSRVFVRHVLIRAAPIGVLRHQIHIFHNSICRRILDAGSVSHLLPGNEKHLCPISHEVATRPLLGNDCGWPFPPLRVLAQPSTTKDTALPEQPVPSATWLGGPYRSHHLARDASSLLS